MIKKFSVRPFFGHDCNSHDGFNNGCYLEEIEVMAQDETQAIVRAMAVYRKTIGNYQLLKDKKSHDTCFFNTGDTSGFYIETYYADDNGDELTESEWMDQNETEEYGSYSYQYVEFSEVTEIKSDLKKYATTNI